MEKITIDLFEDYYHINVDYIFRKDGETVRYEVDFTETDFTNFTAASAEKIRNFETSVNGRKTDIILRQADILKNMTFHTDETPMEADTDLPIIF